MRYLSDRHSVDVYLKKANHTLSDEAGNKLLLLYGRADTALEIAWVEHGDFAVISGYCNKYCKRGKWSTNRSPDRHEGGTLAPSPDSLGGIRESRDDMIECDNFDFSPAPQLPPGPHNHGQITDTMESLLRHSLQEDHIHRDTATLMDLHRLPPPTGKAIQHPPPATTKAIHTARR